jgi:hypothetical protein
MGVALWYENRVDNSKAKKDLDAFGNYAEKFGKTAFTRFLGPAAVIGTLTGALTKLSAEMENAFGESLSAAKLDVTVSQFKQISEFAELTGYSIDEVAKNAKKLQGVMDQLTPQRAGTPEETAILTGGNVAAKQLKGQFGDFWRKSQAYFWVGLKALMNPSGMGFGADVAVQTAGALGEGIATLRAIQEAADILAPEKAAKMEKFGVAAPKMTADALIAVGGANALSGTQFANFQRESLQFQEQIAHFSKTTAESVTSIQKELSPTSGGGASGFWGSSGASGYW